MLEKVLKTSITTGSLPRINSLSSLARHSDADTGKKYIFSSRVTMTSAPEMDSVDFQITLLCIKGTKIQQQNVKTR